jgi:NAD(P)H-dependent FMN reductase
LTVKILILAGGTREGSFDRRLARAAAAEARAQGADVTPFELAAGLLDKRIARPIEVASGLYPGK